MLQRSLSGLALVLLLALCGEAAAQNVGQIRLMLHPSAAAAGTLPPAALAELQALAGVPLSLSGTTRTGALEFSLDQPLSSSDAGALLRRLREDRSVLWAESVGPAPLAAKDLAPSAFQGSKLMVRLAGDPTPDWNVLLPRFGDLIGLPLTVDRQIGNVWVLSLLESVPEDLLVEMAGQLQLDSAVQYADPARHAFPRRVPNDPLYSQQWALSDPVGGLNAPAAWDLQTGSSGVTVAVIDTGITAHPDLVGRILPGYDFITDAGMANDGNGRDPDPSDPGDGTRDNQCGDGIPGEPSFFHGTFVSGLIAADTNNGVGIAGLDWNAKILPVRVLGVCGGTFDDILDGLMWAVGQPVAGVPPNPNPARVINLSLGGVGPCPQSFQDAINIALAQGAVVVAAAGNDSEDAMNSAPANCSGVITVGASTRGGDITQYSNFGPRVNLSAPGGDGEIADWILSTGNDGTAGPGNPDYEFAVGTSFSAPYVSGTASLMIARNANLTPGRIQDIITGTARAFAAGTACGVSAQCGAGLLDTSLALQSTLPGESVAPPGTVPVIEYYRSDKDHYFMSANAAEVAFVDSALGSIFQRTGELFYAWPDPSLAPPGAVPVCRFYAASPLIDSHYYTASPSECQFILTHYPGIWTLELPAAFWVLPPDVTGACPSGTLPVYRFFDNRQDANQRHTIDLSVRREMLNRAWVPQGTPPNDVIFCTPI
ncbi:MAG TPA: S8 family peptidase [Casimicrobiaceae bacterium]|nr:S8 family peptidase [Casimicrobiaceae bacterium]